MNYKNHLNVLMEKDYHRNTVWEFSDELFEGTFNEEYKEVETEDLYNVFVKCMHRVNQKNMFSLLDDEKISDGDAREAIIHRPTHIMLAWGVYLKLTYHQWKKEDEVLFQNIMEHVFEMGIYGHGFDGFYSIQNTVIMYLKAGAMEFIDCFPHFSNYFNEYIHDFYSNYSNSANYDNPNGKTVYIGFNSKMCNNSIRYVQAMKENKMIPLFVYGSLMKGEVSNYLLDTSIYCGRFLLNGYSMYNLGWYPGIVKKNYETVQGEVYFINEDTHRRLNEYEGSMYSFEKVNVESEYGDLRAYCYVYKGSIRGKEMIRTRWHEKNNAYIWYAAYGSNLNEERFKCYIQGGLCMPNARYYDGCHDKTLWKESECTKLNGRLYFAKESPSWNHKGVAFFDDTVNGIVYSKVYKITINQLKDIQRQEGRIWYGKMKCLGIHKDGCPIYTLTNENVLPSNKPDDRYIQLLSETLYKDHIHNKAKVNQYLNRAMNR